MNTSFVLHAEIADRTYLKWIRQVEDLIPELWVASPEEKKANIEIIKSNLTKLRANTKDFYRLNRINKAAFDFNDFMQADMNPSRAPQDIAPNIAENQSPTLKDLTSEQQLETLLLYVQSLASTADVAIVVGQKNNAQTILVQATMQFPIMHNILNQHPELVQKFSARIQALHDRIVKIQSQAD
jgi:hypothetical protein